MSDSVACCDFRGECISPYIDEFQNALPNSPDHSFMLECKTVFNMPGIHDDLSVSILVVESSKRLGSNTKALAFSVRQPKCQKEPILQVEGVF